ncbi:MAG TPA: acyl-CoA dehydrogenase [Beijerinckiaceae bacterium]|jgi:alkylation response protein AidB-like acyl-CoA dehydrogenase|nr:acyl-CoA dehydrogenase [Beijerinckiaceae bacterium]
MTYRAPLADILFTMNHAAGLGDGIASGLYGDLAYGFAETVLGEAAKFAEGVLAPLNRIGDTIGARYENGVVTTAPGWRDAYRRWIEGGWNALTASQEFGGMGLPHLLQAACLDMFSGANTAFTLAPILTMGAIDALVQHGSPELRRLYLGKIVSGEWTATMNLTEPQAGSDLNAVACKATRAEDGTYRIIGTKIFITYGEHDLADNIIHLVLARLPDAPPGTRGISLFLVPKFLPDAQGAPGTRNDLRASGIEHKMGIHGSPTCTMSYGDNAGAIGFLVGEENRGLACMFTMMNDARLAIGLQGVGLAEAATRQAILYARARRQGRAPGHQGSGMSPIAAHPDVARMLMTMKALTAAARAICYMTAAATDAAQRAIDVETRRQSADRASLLTPLAKAFATDIANEVTSLGVQVHGGMGFIEETGAAQLMRDARIAAIYEGTNGIQAIDLVQRKLSLSSGAAIEAEIARMRATIAALAAAGDARLQQSGMRLAEAVAALTDATLWMTRTLATAPAEALAGATPYLRLFGLARGGTALADMTLAALAAEPRDSDPTLGDHVALVRFFAENIAISAPGLAVSIMSGADFVHESDRLLGVDP